MYGKTFDEVLASILVCIFYPEITISLTAQTKENAADLLKDKYEEMIFSFEQNCVNMEVAYRREWKTM